MTQYLLPGPTPEAEPMVEVGLAPEKFHVRADLFPECEQLLTMLTYRRPERSRSERKFIKKFLIPLDLQVDSYGNYYKRIGSDPILWSCHTDTVHNRKGMLEVGFAGVEVGISSKDSSNCLGADDTAGIWLMVQMIKANKPGLYIFHRDEEGGRKGSAYIAKTMQKQLKDIKFAIALDRKGQDSVITHQMGQRCCSTEFAQSMIDGLGMDYKEDPTGSYTDTASYVDLIPECTNLSVGYTGAHTRFERLNLDFIFKLRKALLALDVRLLIEKRKPGEKEYKSYPPHQGYGMGSWGNDYGDMGWGSAYYNGCTANTSIDKHYTNKQSGPTMSPATRFARGLVDIYGREIPTIESHYEEVPKHGLPSSIVDCDDDEMPDDAKDYDAVVRLVKANPEAIADILEGWGMGFAQVQEEIMSMYGTVNA